jgi:hypothetical protein
VPHAVVLPPRPSTADHPDDEAGEDRGGELRQLYRVDRTASPQLLEIDRHAGHRQLRDYVKQLGDAVTL